MNVRTFSPFKIKLSCQSRCLFGNVASLICCRPRSPSVSKTASRPWPTRVSCSCLPSCLWLGVIKLVEEPQKVLLTSQKYTPPWLWNSIDSSGGFSPQPWRQTENISKTVSLSVCQNVHGGQCEGCIECWKVLFLNFSKDEHCFFDLERMYTQIHLCFCCMCRRLTTKGSDECVVFSVNSDTLGFFFTGWSAQTVREWIHLFHQTWVHVERLWLWNAAFSEDAQHSTLEGSASHLGLWEDF